LKNPAIFQREERLERTRSGLRLRFDVAAKRPRVKKSARTIADPGAAMYYPTGAVWVDDPVPSW
jgi:hypothetical protein